MTVSIIVASTSDGVIGLDNKIPWNVPEDMKFFKETTTGHVVIMGRMTHESIGRPLPNRMNYVISRNLPEGGDGSNLMVFNDLIKAISSATTNHEHVFIIGGGQIYQEALASGLVDTIYHTTITGKYEGDTFFHIPPEYCEAPMFIFESEKCVIYRLDHSRTY